MSLTTVGCPLCLCVRISPRKPDLSKSPDRLVPRPPRAISTSETGAEGGGGPSSACPERNRTRSVPGLGAAWSMTRRGSPTSPFPPPVFTPAAPPRPGGEGDRTGLVPWVACPSIEDPETPPASYENPWKGEGETENEERAGIPPGAHASLARSTEADTRTGEIRSRCNDPSRPSFDEDVGFEATSSPKHGKIRSIQTGIVSRRGKGRVRGGTGHAPRSTSEETPTNRPSSLRPVSSFLCGIFGTVRGAGGAGGAGTPGPSRRSTCSLTPPLGLEVGRERPTGWGTGTGITCYGPFPRDRSPIPKSGTRSHVRLCDEHEPRTSPGRGARGDGSGRNGWGLPTTPEGGIRTLVETARASKHAHVHLLVVFGPTASVVLRVPVHRTKLLQRQRIPVHRQRVQAGASQEQRRRQRSDAIAIQGQAHQGFQLADPHRHLLDQVVLQVQLFQRRATIDAVQIAYLVVAQIDTLQSRHAPQGAVHVRDAVVPNRKARQLHAPVDRLGKLLNAILVQHEDEQSRERSDTRPIQCDAFDVTQAIATQPEALQLRQTPDLREIREFVAIQIQHASVHHFLHLHGKFFQLALSQTHDPCAFPLVQHVAGRFDSRHRLASTRGVVSRFLHLLLLPLFHPLSLLHDMKLSGGRPAAVRGQYQHLRTVSNSLFDERNAFVQHLSSANQLLISNMKAAFLLDLPLQAVQAVADVERDLQDAFRSLCANERHAGRTAVSFRISATCAQTPPTSRFAKDRHQLRLRCFHSCSPSSSRPATWELQE
eukprot:scaffold776_cov347-Pavlova_lutheri.AAC.23